MAGPDAGGVTATYRRSMRQAASATDATTGAECSVFRSILCGVDGSRQSFEAARQAAVLATDGSALTLLAVTWEAGVGPTATALLSRRRALEALARAGAAARALGVSAETKVVSDVEASARLL